VSICYQSDQSNSQWLDPWLPTRTVVRRRRWGGLVPVALVTALLTLQVQVLFGVEGLWADQVVLALTDVVLLGLATWGVVRCLRPAAVTEVRSVGAALSLVVMLPVFVVGALFGITILLLWITPFLWAVSLPAILRSLFVLLGRTAPSAWDAAAPLGLSLFGSFILLVVALMDGYDESDTLGQALLLLTVAGWMAISIVAGVACLVDAARYDRQRDAF
jgi:hypothetical protein